MKNSILRLRGVVEKTGLSRATIYVYMTKGLFPKPIPIGIRAVGWLLNDLENWISMRSRELKRSE